jgi:hypothetical protein
MGDVWYWLTCIPYRISEWFAERKRQIKYSKQIRTRGFSDVELWNMDGAFLRWLAGYYPVWIERISYPTPDAVELGRLLRQRSLDKDLSDFSFLEPGTREAMDLERTLELIGLVPLTPQAWRLVDQIARWFSLRLDPFRQGLHGHPGDLTEEQWDAMLIRWYNLMKETVSGNQDAFRACWPELMGRFFDLWD